MYLIGVLTEKNEPMYPYQAGEKVYIHVEATAQTLSKRASSSAAAAGAGGGGGGRGGKRAAAREEQRKAASIRFRTEVGGLGPPACFVCVSERMFPISYRPVCLYTVSARHHHGQGGVEGRLPTDIASVLMPLLAASGAGSVTGKNSAAVEQVIMTGCLSCSTFHERTGAEEEHKGSVSYVTLEARTVAPIYRTQLFTKVCQVQ